MKSIEVQLQEAQEQIKIVTKENGELKEAISVGRIATAKAERATILKESKLPEPCVARLDSAFALSKDNAGLKEAVNVEVEYVKTLRAPIVKNNGNGDNHVAEASPIEVLQERQFNAYKAGGMSEADASRQSGFKPKK